MENNARKYHWVVIILLIIWIIGGAYLLIDNLGNLQIENSKRSLQMCASGLICIVCSVLIYMGKALGFYILCGIIILSALINESFEPILIGALMLSAFLLKKDGKNALQVMGIIK